jgi:hypothetical protein
MKILSYAGFGMGLIAGAMALYLHFVAVPEAHSAENTISRITSSTMYDRESQPAEMEALREQSGQNIDYGEYTLLLGGLAFLLSIYPAVKKNKYAMAGAALGVVTFFIGAAYGTHMFS